MVSDYENVCTVRYVLVCNRCLYDFCQSECQEIGLPDVDADNSIVSKELHLHNAVIENTEIIDHNDNWAHLQYLEAYCIKTMSPEINIGLKASKELQLFK